MLAYLANRSYHGTTGCDAPTDRYRDAMAMAGTGKVALLCELYSTVCTCWICTFFCNRKSNKQTIETCTHTRGGDCAPRGRAPMTSSPTTPTGQALLATARSLSESLILRVDGIAQPVQTLVESLSGSGAGRLDVPLPLPQRIEPELWRKQKEGVPRSVRRHAGGKKSRDGGNARR